MGVETRERAENKKYRFGGGQRGWMGIRGGGYSSARGPERTSQGGGVRRQSQGQESEKDGGDVLVGWVRCACGRCESERLSRLG